jgi:hypothetical protein
MTLSQRIGMWLTFSVLLVMCLYPPCVKNTWKMVGADVAGNRWRPVATSRFRGFVLDVYAGSGDTWSRDPGPDAKETGPNSGIGVLPVPGSVSHGAQTFIEQLNEAALIEQRTIHYQALVMVDWPRFFIQLGAVVASGLALVWALRQPAKSQVLRADSPPPFQASEGAALCQPPSNPLPYDHEIHGLIDHEIELRQNLSVKCLGDQAKVDRLIVYEHDCNPKGSAQELMKAAIERWERDNR